MQAEIAGLTDLAQTDVQKLDVVERYKKFDHYKPLGFPILIRVVGQTCCLY
jgi:hypothetical protein